MLVVGGIEFVEPRQFRLGERRRFGRKPDQPFDQIMAGIGIERGLDPGETLLGCERLRLFFHLRRREALEQGYIDPGFAVVVVEQFALDPTAGGDVGVAADQAGARIAASDGPGEDHAPDAVGIGRIVGRGNLLEDAGLDFLVRGRTEGLGDVESDLARGQCLEHDGRERRETQTPLDEADRQAEAARNIFNSRTACDKRRKSLGFVGWVHGEAVEVFRKAGLDRGFSTVFEHEAGDFVIAGENLFVRERKHRAAAALAGFDLELALGRGPTMRFCSNPWAAMLALSSASAAGSL
jgi:hypothetical protein